MLLKYGRRSHRLGAKSSRFVVRIGKQKRFAFFNWGKTSDSRMSKVRDGYWAENIEDTSP